MLSPISSDLRAGGPYILDYLLQISLNYNLKQLTNTIICGKVYSSHLALPDSSKPRNYFYTFYTFFQNLNNNLIRNKIIFLKILCAINISDFYKVETKS